MEFDKRSFLKDKKQKEFSSSFKDIDLSKEGDVRIPEILYLANKAENGFEGDLLSDFYTMFNTATSELDQFGLPVEPLFISAEHGDGLPDLFQALRKRIPDTTFVNHDIRKKKRVERFNEYKKMLLDEFIETKEDEMDDHAEAQKSAAKGIETKEEDLDEMEAQDIETLINQWNKDFDKMNADPEDNSDFDSDNDINPLDTLTPAGKYKSSKGA